MESTQGCLRSNRPDRIAFVSNNDDDDASGSCILRMGNAPSSRDVDFKFFIGCTSSHTSGPSNTFDVRLTCLGRDRPFYRGRLRLPGTRIVWHRAGGSPTEDAPPAGRPVDGVRWLLELRAEMDAAVRCFFRMGFSWSPACIPAAVWCANPLLFPLPVGYTHAHT